MSQLSLYKLIPMAGFAFASLRPPFLFLTNRLTMHAPFVFLVALLLCSFPSPGPAQVIAVFAGSETEDEIMAELSFLDLPSNRIFQSDTISEFGCIPLWMYEWENSLLLGAFQHRARTFAEGTVIAEYSLEDRSFTQSSSCPHYLYMDYFHASKKRFFLYSNDTQYQVSLNRPKWQLLEIPYQQPPLLFLTLDSERFVYAKGNRLYLTSDLYGDKEELLYEASERIIGVDQGILTNHFLLVSLFVGDEKRLWVFSGEKYEKFHESDLNDWGLIGWKDEGKSLYLYRSRFEHPAPTFFVELGETNLQDQSSQMLVSLPVHEDHFGGVVSSLVTRSKEYILIGGSNAGGLGNTVPGQLLIYNTGTQQVERKEFPAGSVNVLRELSDRGRSILIQGLDVE